MIDGQVLTGAHTQIWRDDLLETAPAKATAAGRFMATTGTNAIAERIPTVSAISANCTTTSTTFADPTTGTSGPAISVVSGTAVWIAIHARVENNSINGISRFGYRVSGATTASTDANLAAAYQSTAAGVLANMGTSTLYTGLTAGTNTFTMEYRVDTASTGTFSSRRIAGLPF